MGGLTSAIGIAVLVVFIFFGIRWFIRHVRIEGQKPADLVQGGYQAPPGPKPEAPKTGSGVRKPK